MIAQLFDVTDENQALAPTLSADTPVGANTPLLSRSESVLTANGMTPAAFGASSTGRYEWFTGSAAASPSPPGAHRASGNHAFGGSDLATPAGFYIGARYNELSGDNGTYDQSKVPQFETDIGRTIAVNSHFHYWTDVFPWANSTSNAYADSQATAPSIQTVGSPYNVRYES